MFKNVLMLIFASATEGRLLKLIICHPDTDMTSEKHLYF